MRGSKINGARAWLVKSARIRPIHFFSATCILFLISSPTHPQKETYSAIDGDQAMEAPGPEPTDKRPAIPKKNRHLPPQENQDDSPAAPLQDEALPTPAQSPSLNSQSSANAEASQGASPQKPKQGKEKQKACQPEKGKRIKASRFNPDQVPEGATANLIQRLKITKLLIQDFGQAYDYRVHTLKELKQIYEKHLQKQANRM